MGPGLGSRLFSPVRLGSCLLPNRIVMAPMTRSRADGDSVPSPMAATYYAQRAGAGLILSEATHVSPEGVGYPGTPGIYSDAQVAGWRAVTNAVHAQGGRIFVQLWHVGRVSHPCMQPGGDLPLAPSAIAPEGQLYTVSGRQPFVTPRALELSQIAQVVSQFGHAGRLALEAGFDGIDIHAANGYLIDQFLRDGSNHRSDAYGGSVPNRARFLLDVLEAILATWEPSQIGVRISPLQSFNTMRDRNPLEVFSYVADSLATLGIGYLHVVEPCEGHPMATSEGQTMLRMVRARFPGCMIVDGGRDGASAEQAIQATRADLVALATPFIANPDLIHRLQAGIPLASPDRSLYYQGGGRGYIDYPAASPSEPNKLTARA